MIGPRTFTFNGVKSDAYFLTRDIQRPPLPPIHVETITVPRRAGAYPVASTLGVREITVGVWLLKENWTDLRTATRAIAAWLYTEDDKQLTFSDEPDKYYLARVQGEISYTEQLYYWEGEITFLCSDPFAYATVEKNKYQDPVRNANLVLDGDFSNTANFDTWAVWNANSVKNTTVGAVLSNGKTKNFLRIQSTTGVAAGVNFGLNSTRGFSIVAGNTYTLTFLVACHSNSVLEPAYSYLITVGNTTASNQKLTTDVITNHEYYASFGSDNFNLNIYRYKLTFTALYTDTNTQLLLGSKTAKDLTGTNSYGLMYVSEIKLEESATATPFYYEPTLFQNLGTYPVYPRILVVPEVAGQTYFKISKGTESIIVYGDLSGGVFGVKDTFMIDCETNVVYDYSTGERMMTLVDINSDFFALDVGNNYLQSDSETGFTYRVYWRERWL